MCGIAGCAGDLRAEVSDELAVALHALDHRGPDDRGTYVAPGVAIGMTRLAIIDLAGGRQPKTAAGGAIQVVFNGEIYNHRQLRRELEGHHAFVSESDTEVIAAAYARWGTECFARLDGMFAIAIWDDRDRALVLARDRLGEKPLYVAEAQGTVRFASELKALAAFDRPRELDRVAIAEYLHLGFIASPRTIWLGVAKLEPATWLRFADDRLTRGTYWDPPPVDAPRSDPHELEAKLGEAVRSRLLADVEVGVLLSGGIDSSLVASLAARHQPLRAFSISFDDARWDERDKAALVATQLGMQHEVIPLRVDDALAIVPDLADIYDEPLADQSVLPTTLVTRATAERVKVALTGDGGDELFSGYARYARIRSVDRLRRALGPMSPFFARWSTSSFGPASRIGNMAALAGSDRTDTHRNLTSVFHPTLGRALLDDPSPLDVVVDELRAAFRRSGTAQRFDLRFGLGDGLLTKVDRASMAASLELRSPFLSHELVEWASRLPVAAIGEPGGKALLRGLARRTFGSAIADAPKRGFSVPLADWLRGPLRPMLRDQLDHGWLVEHGLIDPSVVAMLEHRLDAGRLGTANPLWALLVLELWCRRWMVQA